MKAFTIKRLTWYVLLVAVVSITGCTSEETPWGWEGVVVTTHPISTGMFERAKTQIVTNTANIVVYGYLTVAVGDSVSMWQHKETLDLGIHSYWIKFKRSYSDKVRMVANNGN